MGDVGKWCQMCGAAPGEPCTIVSGIDAGAVRPGVHWHRSADERPVVLVPDEPALGLSAQQPEEEKDG
jgi:hypothetical protein